MPHSWRTKLASNLTRRLSNNFHKFTHVFSGCHRGVVTLAPAIAHSSDQGVEAGSGELPLERVGHALEVGKQARVKASKGQVYHFAKTSKVELVFGHGRPLRIEYPGAVYHLTARGDRREPIVGLMRVSRVIKEYENGR